GGEEPPWRPASALLLHTNRQTFLLCHSTGPSSRPTQRCQNRRHSHYETDKTLRPIQTVRACPATQRYIRARLARWPFVPHLFGYKVCVRAGRETFLHLPADKHPRRAPRHLASL